MSDKNTSYADVWAAWQEMEVAQRKSIGSQMLTFLKGASLTGVVEILSNAPIEVKKVAWKLWATEADLSGYLLADVIALQETETPTIAYEVVKSWLHQADLTRANEGQVQKMSLSLTTREDKVKLWTRWYKSTDLTMYDLPEFGKLLARMYPEVAIGMNETWIFANGQWGVAQMKSLNVNRPLVERLNKLGLPAEVIHRWNELRK